MHDLDHPEVQAGMAAAVELVRQAGVISGETCTRFSDDADPGNWVDGRDYARVADCAAQALQRSFVDATEQHRQGFLLALADLLCQAGDEMSILPWRPGETIAEAFEAARGHAGRASSPVQDLRKSST